MQPNVWKVLDFIGRHGFIACVIATVGLTLGSKQITGAVMIEISGFAALAILIANAAAWLFTSHRFTLLQGGTDVLGKIILGAFLFVGLCVIGIYYAKTDGSLADSSTVQRKVEARATQSNTDTSRYQREDGTQRR